MKVGYIFYVVYLYILYIFQAEGMGMNPLYLLWPVTLTLELAFMMPSSSGSAAIMLSSGTITVTDMVGLGVYVLWIPLFEYHIDMVGLG